MLKKSSVWFLLLFVLALTSCGHVPQAKLTPVDSKALVHFIGDEWGAGGWVYDSEKILSHIGATTQFDYLAEPGKHLFIALRNNKAFMEANLEAGKTYYVFVPTKTVRKGGYGRFYANFVPVKKGSDLWAKAIKYEKKKIRTLGTDKYRDLQEQKWAHKMPALIEQYWAGDFDAYEWPTLDAEDGI